MAIIQAFSPFGLNMSFGDPLDIDFNPEPAFSSTNITFPTLDGG